MTGANLRKLAVLFLATTAAGCGAEELLDGEETISEGGQDSIQVIQQGLTVNRRLHTIKSITTNGKRMTLGVWECWNETKLAHPIVGCWVDSDYVVVGGSGGTDTGSPGALLTASYPDTSLSAWTVESKDHGEPYPHFLHAFAHGIKIDGMEPRDLRQHMNVVIRTSSPATNHPRLSASNVPSDR